MRSSSLEELRMRIHGSLEAPEGQAGLESAAEALEYALVVTRITLSLAPPFGLRSAGLSRTSSRGERPLPSSTPGWRYVAP